jgi:hypothetical protein
MLRRVALVRSDFSEELSASIIRVTRIGERGTTLVTTSVVRRRYVPLKRRFLQEPHGVTSQKTPFFKLRVGLLLQGLRFYKYIKRIYFGNGEKNITPITET